MIETTVAPVVHQLNFMRFLCGMEENAADVRVPSTLVHLMYLDRMAAVARRVFYHDYSQLVPHTNIILFMWPDSGGLMSF